MELIQPIKSRQHQLSSFPNLRVCLSNKKVLCKILFDHRNKQTSSQYNVLPLPHSPHDIKFYSFIACLDQDLAGYWCLRSTLKQ